MLLAALVAADGDKVDVKDEAERWFQKLSKNWMGKRFMEKADCKNFFKHMEEQHPAFAAENANKLNIMSVCASQKQIERDRRDLQDYAVKYFNDPEETELSTCAEFAEDFVSEYSRTFKGEKGEAEAYCYFFKEEGNLASLRKVQAEHKEKTRHMDDAIREAKSIYQETKEGVEEL
eukprot:Tamp_33350.p1 GENE.Tamp_33350~~Tamp_33350.p1  ORF type:complete len:194 (+),score=68.00 Tamp_33350:56-583(+)